MLIVDLKWLIPLVIGSIGFVGCVAGMVWRKNRSWSLIVAAVLSTVLVGASVLTKVSVSGDGITVETAQASLAALENIEKTLRVNVEAVARISSRVQQLAVVTSELANQPQVPPEIKSKAKGLAETTGDLQGLIKRNELSLKEIQSSNTIIRDAISKAVRLPLRF